MPTTVLVYYWGSIQLLCEEVSAECCLDYAKNLHDAGLKVEGIYDLNADPL